MSFFQRGLSRAVGEKSDGALFVMSDGPGVDKVLQGFNDLTIGGHPVVGRLVVVDAQKPASLAKVPSADGEGADVVDGVAGGTQSLAVLHYDGVLLAVDIGVVKLDGKLSVTLVQSHLDLTVDGGGGVDVDVLCGCTCGCWVCCHWCGHCC